MVISLTILFLFLNLSIGFKSIENCTKHLEVKVAMNKENKEYETICISCK